MAPSRLDYPASEPVSKTIPICSDPSVVVSENASKRVKELWWLHGHPHSKRYLDPALNSLAALVRHDGVAYRGQKAFLYPLSAEATTPYAAMNWDEFDKATESIALSYANLLAAELEEANTKKRQPTVALLGGGKTIEYFCTELALQKLGVRVLLLAESNALKSLHHLLETCNAVAVITDSKNASTDTNGAKKIDMIEELPLAPTTKEREVNSVKFQDFGDIWERHTFIIHSSGSTGMPKPIIHTNRSMMLIARMYRLFQEFEANNWFLLFPLYHIAGISIALSNLPNGKLLSFPPLSWPPSSSSIVAAWKTLSSMGHPVDITHCAPTLIENMYEYITSTGGDFAPLTSLKVLQPGGAALSESLVKALIDNGVNVKSTYGSTEIGPPMRTIPHTRVNPKCYAFRNLYPDSPYFKMEKVADGLYECVVYKGFELAAELWEGKPDGEPYRTNDLFIQDPPGSGFFVLQGRRDDILVHSNGENTSAGALQLDIQTSSRYINKALALGHSRPCVTLLVELNDPHDPDDIEVRESVWQAVQEVNAKYPGHSQITQSMIYFLPQGSTLPVTPKGNVKRKEAERIYKAEIEALYTDEFVPTPASTTDSEQEQQPLSEFLRNLFASLSNTPAGNINDWTTLYDLGIDSRLALSLRSSLQKHLEKPLSLSTLFENPSISQLLSVFAPNTNDAFTNGVETKQSSHETVRRMISKLEGEFKSWPARDSSELIYNPAEKETILITGATGSLGTALLEVLAASSHVEHIYAMIRPSSSSSILEKLYTSFISRGLETSILPPLPSSHPNPSRKPSKITPLPLSLPDPLLGLPISTYTHLASSVTTIIQNGWKMDFNQSVEDFEGDCIRNTMSLLRLAVAGRGKRMAFVSSVSTCMGSGGEGMKEVVREEKVGDDPSVALGTGYALSKYVVERILQTASHPTSTSLNIPTTILRLGQICGHTRTGTWNPSEMWPIMFASSAHPSINALPELHGKSIDWIPVDIAASGVADILLASQSQSQSQSQDGISQSKAATIRGEANVTVERELGNADAETRSDADADELENNCDDNYRVHNIVNPHPIPWSELLSMLQKSALSPALSPSRSPQLTSIPMKDWVGRLNAVADASSSLSSSSTSEVPGLRLLQFFEDMMDDTSESKVFETKKSEEISAALRLCPAFCQEWIDGNVRVWRESGFIS